ncbi:serine hydrolase [Filibacter tadaridae]|uniref:Penicillin-binding protein PbpX n=1 Tax=Filibacter tadaridae TaxID=2483811 RepID=A0A3P5WQK8_9BACL|nr:serine hydrolase [Filibacter tadaridae]VDC23988.1 Putative penicillin-binding protein PbpX [Filibacter tadaridae]
MKKAFVISVLMMILCYFPSTALAAIIQGNTPSGIAYSDLKQQVDDYAADYIGNTTVGASIAVVKDGELIINTSYGYADLEKQVEVTPDSVFEWGSATKLLVWTSVMQLVEQGKLDLDENIQKYLPKDFFTKLHYDTPITMLNLMHHDAGWEDKYTDLFYLSADDVKPLLEVLHISEPSQVNKPGEVVAYSNYGVALAGYIVESITGQPFYEYVNEHIFTVLDMKDTAIHPSQKDNKGVAEKRESIHGYSVANKGEFSRSKNERVFIGLYPAGSAIGTAEDAAKFIATLMPADGKSSPLFQSNDTLTKMLTTSGFYDNGIPRNAHGFWEGMYGVDVLEHGGNTDSFSSNFTFSKEEKLGVIIMTNQTAESGLSYGLPVLVYGDYATTKDEEMLPDTHELKGDYFQARQAYKGFSKLMGVLMTGHLKVIDENSFSMLGMTFKQIAPYVYKSTNDYNMFIHFTMNAGEVEKASMMVTDLLPVSKSMNLFIMVSLIASVIAILSIIVSLLTIIINAFRNRKKAVSFTPMKKWNALLNLAGGVALLNFAIMAFRVYSYVSYESLMIHFGIFYGYIVFVGVCVGMIGVQWKKASYTRMQKVGYILSCVAALLLVGLIVGWELYK